MTKKYRTCSVTDKIITMIIEIHIIISTIIHLNINLLWGFSARGRAEGKEKNCWMKGIREEKLGFSSFFLCKRATYDYFSR